MMRMLRNRVAIFLLPDPDISKGGIIIPNEAKERSDQGIIKYVGEGCDEFDIGDYVMFSGYSGTNIELEDEGRFTVMHKDYIIAKIENPNYQVPGLYFRDSKGWRDLENQMEAMLNGYAQGDSPGLRDIMDVITKYNPYFSANYEKVMELAGEAYYNSPFHVGNKIGWKTGSKSKKVDFRNI